MGNSASRATRKLPKRSEPPAWAGKQTPNPTELPTGVNRERARDKSASEHKTAAIKQDAWDPHFLANLQRLGPVKVDHHMKAIRTDTTASNTVELFKARKDYEHDLEAAAQQHTRPSKADTRFYPSQLSMALNARKGTASPNMMDRVVDGYEVDIDKLESVARFVNTPSVAKEGVRTFVDKDGNERTIAKAIWIDAPYADLTSTPSS